MAARYRPTRYRCIYEQGQLYCYQAYKKQEKTRITATTVALLLAKLAKKHIFPLLRRSESIEARVRTSKAKANANAKAKAKAKAKARASAEARAEVQTAAKAKAKATRKGKKARAAAPRQNAEAEGQTASKPFAKRKAKAIARQDFGKDQAKANRKEAEEAEESEARALQAVMNQLPRTMIVIRSHMRPLYAAKTAKLMEQMWEGDLRVFVEGSQLSEYSRIFALEGAGHHLIAEGDAGCGPQVAAAQALLSAEGGGHLVILDDNLSSLCLCDCKPTKLAFGQFLGHAWRMMQVQGCSGWSAAARTPFGNIVAWNAKGKFGLKFLQGACFGVRIGPNQHHEYFNCIHGNIHDSLERSLRT
jgi:hypothetical protein